jgi:hypothetical protein
VISTQDIVRLLPPRTTTYRITARAALRSTHWRDTPTLVRRADHFVAVPPQLGARLVAGLQALSNHPPDERP